MPTESYAEPQTWMGTLKKIFLEYGRFKLSETALENLKEDIPEQVAVQLDVLKEQEPVNEQEFLNAVEKQIGTDQLAEYEKFILKKSLQDFNLFDKLEEQGITVHETIQNRYNELSSDDKQQIRRDFWEMSRSDELSPEEQHKLYKRISEQYKDFYEWEEEEGPGWMFGW